MMQKQSSQTLQLVGVEARSAHANQTLRPRATRIPSSRLLMSMNQLAIMVHNGIDLTDALTTVARHARHPRLAARLQAIHQAILGGSCFSKALKIHGQGFPPSLAALVAAAESAGEVPQALTRFSKLLRSEVQLRSTVTGALIYPVILIVASTVVMLALVFGVLPQFSEVFQNMGRPVPLMTEILLDFGRWCQTYWIGIGLAGLSLIVGAVQIRRLPQFQRFFDWALLSLPLLRDSYRPLACGRMFRLLGSMIAGGVPLLEAVRLTRASLCNQYFIEMLSTVENDVLEGNSICQSLEGNIFLPPEAAQMVRTGERTGRLAEVLNDCGEFYEEQGERMLRRCVHALEPVIILAMGVVVAAVVLSIMLPLLDISSVA